MMLMVLVLLLIVVLTMVMVGGGRPGRLRLRKSYGAFLRARICFVVFGFG
jgi:hypothetical protein